MEKQMGDLGLDLQDTGDVRAPRRRRPSVESLFAPAHVCVCVRPQSHYAQRARQSRSVARKRKREPSAPPASKVRSQSASRPPRDQSGLRDAKVGGRRVPARLSAATPSP